MEIHGSYFYPRPQNDPVGKDWGGNVFESVWEREEQLQVVKVFDYVLEIGVMLEDEFFEQEQECGGQQAFDRAVEQSCLKMTGRAFKMFVVGELVHVE